MSTLETRKIEPLSGTTVTLGASGDAVTMPAGVTVKTNTVKDAGGNTIWTSNGSGTLSSVHSGLQGGMVYISTTTVSSGVASVAITSGITSTYKEYVIYFVNIHPSEDRRTFQWLPSVNGGSSYGVAATGGGTHSYHKEDDSGGPAISFAGGMNQNSGGLLLTNECNNENDSSSSGELRLYDPANTTYVKHFQSWGHSDFDGGNPYSGSWKYGGYVNTTSAVNAIQFKMSSGNIDSGIFYLYGIR